MKVLLVVDLQPEFRDKEGQYERILDFVKKAKLNGYDRVVATMCCNSPDSPFVKYNNWFDCLNGCMPLEFNSDKVIVKYSYGLPDYSRLSKNNTYDIIGFNTDACVLKIAMDMFDRSYDIRVLTKYCFSSSGLVQHKSGVKLLKHLMSDAVIL